MADNTVERSMRSASVVDTMRNMDIESSAYDRDLRANHELIFGKGSASNPEEEGEMKIISAGNVSVTIQKPEQPASPIQQSVTPPQQQPPSGLSTLAKAGIAAALMATGGGIAAGVPLLIDSLRPEPQVITQEPEIQTKTITDNYRIGEIQVTTP